MAEDVRSKDWREKVDGRLDYYLDSEEGRQELSKMLRKENEAIRKFVAKHRQNIRDIIWLSRYCGLCLNHIERKNRVQCVKLDARIVKPFYGKPSWKTTRHVNGLNEQIVSGIDWDSKKSDVPDELVDKAIERINNGLPYSCFEAKLDT